MSFKEDRIRFKKDWYRIVLEQPDLFSKEAKRYISYLLVDNNADCKDDLKDITVTSMEILNFLSKNPTESYLAREILPNLPMETNNENAKTAKKISPNLAALFNRGYITKSETTPRVYQITTKGLKYLNQIFGDYE